MAIPRSEKRSSSHDQSPDRVNEKGAYTYDTTALPEVGSTEDASHTLHRGLQARQVSMIAIGGAM
jgi:amino acid transporter